MRATRTLILVLMFCLSAIAEETVPSEGAQKQQGTTSSEEPKMPVSPIVGRWRWIDNQIVDIQTNGTFSAAHGRHGTWKEEDKFNRKYVLLWDEGLWKDDLTLSRDGNRLNGRNNRDTKISAERIEE